MIVEKFSKITEELDRLPYRFKTEQELIQEFGPRWRNIYFNLGAEHCFTFTSGMDHLLGKEVDQDYFYEYGFPEHEEFTTCQGGWSIGRKFVTKNKPIKQVPNYAPRRITRTLESKGYVDVEANLKKYPYNLIVVDNKDKPLDKEKLLTLADKYDKLSLFKPIIRSITPREAMYIVLDRNICYKDNTSNPLEKFKVYSGGADYFRDGFFMNEYEGAKPIVITDDQLERELVRIFAPYTPRKINRTLETVKIKKYRE
jgi:hypothetical protein